MGGGRGASGGGLWHRARHPEPHRPLAGAATHCASSCTATAWCASAPRRTSRPAPPTWTEPACTSRTTPSTSTAPPLCSTGKHLPPAAVIFLLRKVPAAEGAKHSLAATPLCCRCVFSGCLGAVCCLPACLQRCGGGWRRQQVVPGGVCGARGAGGARLWGAVGPHPANRLQDADLLPAHAAVPREAAREGGVGGREPSGHCHEALILQTHASVPRAHGPPCVLPLPVGTPSHRLHG